MALARRRVVLAAPVAPEPRRARPPPSDRGSDDESSGDELEAMAAGQQPKAAAPAQLPMTIADKVRLCAATEKDRVMFGKVLDG